MIVEFRTGEGKAERYAALAAELVQQNVDVLVASGAEAVLRAVRDATRTTPIVMIAIDYDPIARGYVAGLPRPGGNITGLFFSQWPRRRPGGWGCTCSPSSCASHRTTM